MEYQLIKQNLNKKGFVHLTKSFESEEIAEIQGLLDVLFESESKLNRFVNSTDKMNFINHNVYEINHTIKIQPNLKKTSVFRKCQEIACELLGKSSTVAFDHAIYKQPGSSSVNWHQDQAYKTSVKKMKSIHFWIPLQDTPIKLGCMKYVTGAENFDIMVHKTAGNKQTLSVSLDEKKLRKDIVFCESLKGDLQIHLPQTLHGSLPNKSNQTRRAWVIHFSPYGYYEPLLPQNLLYNLSKRLESMVRSK